MSKPKDDPMAAGVEMIEEMMKEARKPNSGVPNDEKIKMLAVYAKLKQVSASLKQGGMGRGFDDASLEDDSN